MEMVGKMEAYPVPRSRIIFTLTLSPVWFWYKLLMNCSSIHESSSPILRTSL